MKLRVLALACVLVLVGAVLFVLTRPAAGFDPLVPSGFGDRAEEPPPDKIEFADDVQDGTPLPNDRAKVAVAADESVLRWSDLLEPIDRDSGERVGAAQVACLTGPEEDFHMFELGDPVDVALFEGEVLAEVRSDGHLFHPFLPRELDRGAGQPRVLELVPAAPMVVEIVGEAPRRSVFAMVEFAPVNKREHRAVALRLGQFLGLEPGTPSKGGDDPAKNRSAVASREQAWRLIWDGDDYSNPVALDGLDSLQLYHPRFGVDPEDDDRRLVIPRVPMGIELSGYVQPIPPPTMQVPPESFFVGALDSEGAFAGPWYVPPFVHDGTDTPRVRVTFNGAARITWSLPEESRPSGSSGDAFALVHVNGTPHHLESGRLQDGRYAYRDVTPGLYRFSETWKNSTGSELSKVNIEIEVPVGGDVVLGELASVTGNTIELKPRVVLGDGVDPDRRAEIEAAIVLEASVVEDGEPSHRSIESHSVRTSGGSGLLRGVSDGRHSIRAWSARLSGSPGSATALEGLAVHPVRTTEFECTGDTVVEVEVRVERTHSIDVGFVESSGEPFRVWNCYAVRQSDGALVALSKDPPSKDPTAAPGDRRFRADLAPGDWRLLGTANSDRPLVASGRVTVGPGGGSFTLELVASVSAVMDPDDPRLSRSNAYSGANPLALPVGWPPAIGYQTCQNNGRDEQGRPRFSTLLPETEYEFTADGTRFVTGAPGSVLELSR